MCLKFKVKGILLFAFKIEAKGILLPDFNCRLLELIFDGSVLNIVGLLIIIVLYSGLLSNVVEFGLEKLLALNEYGIFVWTLKFVVIGMVVSIFREEVIKIMVSVKIREVLWFFFELML